MANDVEREAEDDEADDVVSADGEVTNPPPAKTVEEDEVAEPEAKPEVEEEVKEQPKDFSDTLLEEWMADPMRKAVLDRAIEKEAQRRKDEWAGKEINWLPKEARKEYARNPKKWQEDQEKLKRHDALVAELEAAKRSTVPPKQEAKAPVVPEPEEDTDAEVQKFVSDHNLKPENAEIIAALLKLTKSKAKPTSSAAEVEAILAKREWEREAAEAESQPDYRQSEALRKLAWAESQLGLSPMKALAKAREVLGVKPVKKVSGPPAKGKPAFAKESVADGNEEWDGKTDPIDWLIKRKK